MALTSDDLNYLIFQYLMESGYGHSAFVFGNESLAKDAQVAPGEFSPSSLVDIVQKGIQYKELQTRLAANGSALRAYTAAELLRSKDPSDLIKAAASPANPAASTPSARPRFTDHKGHVYSLAWHPSEMLLASGAADSSGRIYHVGDNPKALKSCDLLPHSVPGNSLTADVTGISWSPKGYRLASVTSDGHMRIWGRNGCLHMCTADLPPLQGVRFSPGGEYIAAHAAAAGLVAVWHASTGVLASDVHRHHGAILSLCWLSDDSFATCGQDGAVHINRVQQLPPASSAGASRQPRAMNVRGDPEAVENGMLQCHVTVAWERNMHVHHGHVNEVCATADGGWLAAACDDGTVCTWRMQGAGEEVGEPCLLQDPALAPLQLGHKAAVHSARFWQAPPKACPKEGDRKAELGGGSDASGTSPHLLATCSGTVKSGRGASKAPGTEATIKIWDVSRGKLVRTLMPHEGAKQAHAVRWAPDGRHVTCSMFVPFLCVWCVRTGQAVMHVDMGADVSSVEWSHDGAWLAVGMAHGVIELVPFSQ